MQWYEKILIPLDGSRLAELAVDRAADMARQMRSQLVLMQVILPPDDVLPTGVPMDPGEEEYRINTALEYLGNIRDNLISEGIETQAETAFGLAPDGIIHCAESVGATMIVMSTHGLGAEASRPMGSTASAVVGRSRIPVLVIPYR